MYRSQKPEEKEDVKERKCTNTPYKSQIKVLQSIGRGLRLTEDKTQCTLFDIADDLSYNKNSNFTLKHLEERIKIYSTQEFEYEIIPVRLIS